MQEQTIKTNKINIYSLTNSGLNSFCLALYIRTGSNYEEQSENGISHLFEHVVYRNLKKKYKNFYELMALHGISFQGSTYKEFMSFTLTGPHYEFDLAADILCSVFDEINIDSQDFYNEKKRVKAEMREADERYTLDYLYNNEVWQGSKIKNTVLGYCKVIDRTSIKKLSEYKNKFLSENNCFVCVTGNVSSKGLELLTEKIKEVNIPKSEYNLVNQFPVGERFFHRDGKIIFKNGYWHRIIIGFDIDCSKYSNGVLDLLYAVLFMGSKALLHNYLSEDNPIIYSYDSTLEMYDNVGNVCFDFEVDKDKVQDSIKTVVRMLNDVKQGNFNYEASLYEELHKAEMNLDDPETLNWDLAYYNHINCICPLNYSDKYYGRFNVSKEELVAAARDIFRLQNMTVAIKGNKKKSDTDKLERILSELR